MSHSYNEQRKPFSQMGLPERQQMLLDLAKQQSELEKQQLELDRQRLELQKDRLKIVLEIATTMVSQLQSDIDVGQREMVIHSLVPPLLQLAATDGIVTALPLAPTSEEHKESAQGK